MSMSRLLTAVVLGATLVAGCTTSMTGRRQLMLVSEQDAISASKKQYVQTMSKLGSEGKLVTDPKLLARVDTITGRLIAQAIIMRPDTQKWEWSVQVIDEPKTVNAWCMAGGRMALYTGLIQKVDPTDDELAQVMGHEISHALANHTRNACRSRWPARSGPSPQGLPLIQPAAWWLPRRRRQLPSRCRTVAPRKPRRTGSASNSRQRPVMTHARRPRCGKRWPRPGATDRRSS
jgi:predicted Zn-dependent protease